MNLHDLIGSRADRDRHSLIEPGGDELSFAALDRRVRGRYASRCLAVHGAVTATPHLLACYIPELVAVPLLVLWQARVALKAARP